MQTTQKANCLIFCDIIDNFGDIGICWRLARQLQQEHQFNVTLLVNRLDVFAILAPQINPQLQTQTLDGIHILDWHNDTDKQFKTIQPKQPNIDLVIAGFSCQINSTLMNIFNAQPVKPVFINLEYLSAESWIDDCHKMHSIDAKTGLIQHFWFPSFDVKNGGLLRETHLPLLLDDASNTKFWQTLNIPMNEIQPERIISLFSYETPAIHDLLNVLVKDKTKTVLLVPEGKSLLWVKQWLNAQNYFIDFNLENSKENNFWEINQLTIIQIPFLSHDDFDYLLACCDLNIVRGEDSFIRAHWAGKPFIWHIYPQDEQTHLVKLNAYLETQSQLLGTIEHQATLTLWQHLQRAWNRAIDQPENGEFAKYLQQALNALTTINAISESLSQNLQQQKDLTTRLVAFYQEVRLQPDQDMKNQ